MTLEEAIKHAEEVANGMTAQGKCPECAEEHRQLAEWLRDYKWLLEQEPKRCKDCKWWKDGDGFYRRGNNAESQCPINRREVFEGNGYCYMFESQERKVNNG